MMIFNIFLKFLCVTGTHSTIVYKHVNGEIERFTELFAYGLLVTDIIFMLCPLLFTISNYCFLGLRKDSFFLICQMWSVFTIGRNEVDDFANNFSRLKVAIRLENSNRILDTLVCRTCWIFGCRNNGHAMF